MMNLVFAPEITEQWLTVYMDNMAIHMAELPNETDQQHHQKKSTFLTTSYYILLHLIPLILGVRKE